MFEFSQTYLEKEWINIKERKEGLSQLLHFITDLLGVFSVERMMLNKADKVACISREDQESYRKYFRSKNVFYLPFFSPDRITMHEVKNKSVLDVFYMGSDLRNNVNRHGALYIINKIMPVVQRKSSNKFVFHILGKHGIEQLSPYASETIKIHDYVDDLNAFLAKMDIALIPVFYGSGFKVKTYECLQRGFPTIGSSRSLRDFNGIEGEHFLTANTPNEFAKELIKLLDADVRLKLSLNAQKLIKKKFNKEYVKNQLEKIIST